MRRVSELPIDSIPSTVQLGEQFQIKYTKGLHSKLDQFFSYSTTSIVGSAELTDSESKTLIKYDSIRGIDGSPCKVSYQELSLPDQMKDADSRCCVNFLQDDKNWFLCSNKYGDCVTPIRTLSKFMLDACKKKHPKGENPAASAEDLSKIIDNHEKGIWGGWGYYTELPDFSEESKKPVFIKVDKDIAISKEEFIKPFTKLEYGNINWFCGSNKICALRDFSESYSKDNKENISKDFTIWLTKTNHHSPNSCSFFEGAKVSVICLHREDQLANFKASILLNINKKEDTSTVDADSLSDNAILPLLISNGETLIEKRIQFGNDRAIEFETGTPVIEYKKMESVLGVSCDILHSGLNLPENLIESTVKDKCCIGTKYRGSWLYFCDKESECESGIERVAKTLRAKCMKGRYPETSEGGTEVDFNKEIEDEHNEGKWKGYVYFAKLGQEPSKTPMYFSVSKETKIIIQRGPNDERDKLNYEILNNEWICASDLPCSVEEYIARKGLANLNELFGNAMKELNIDSMLYCLALEIRSKVFLFSERHLLMVCPYDRDQVMNLKLAIRNAYFGLVEDTPADTLPFAAEGTVYDILMFNQNTKQLKQVSAMILPDRIQEMITKEELLSYHDLQPMSNLKCGLEFRHLSLPEELVNLNADPECCFDCLKNRDKVYFCVNSALHCVAHSKMMLKRIKADCIRLLAEEGKASYEEVKSSLEQVEFDDTGDVFVIPTFHKKDDWYFMDYPNNIWKGKVHYLVLDKNDKNEAKEIYLTVENGMIRGTTSPEETEPILPEKPVATLFFECNSPVACVPSSYLKQTKKANPSADQKILEKMIKKFFDSHQLIQEIQCLVLEFEDPLFHAIESFLICADDAVQGPMLRKILTNAYENVLENTDFDGEQGKNVPNTSDKDVFSVAIIDDNPDEPRFKNVVMTKHKVKLESTDASVLKYREIEDCQIHQIKALPLALEGKSAVKCCITVLRFGKELSLCSLDIFRCIRSRTMMAKKMRVACMDYKKKSLLQTGGKPFIKEVFDYGRARDGKLITPDIDLTTFKADLIEDAENGRWNGWVYAMPFTERDSHKKIYAYYIQVDKNSINMHSEKGGKLVQTYTTAYMKWICTNFQPCKPSSYLMYYKEKNGYIAQVALKDTVLSFLKQLPVEDEKGCMVLEFEEPNSRAITSEMMCTIDPEEGQELRNAISNAYYLGILKADLKKDIPMPSYMTEKFLVKMWEEDRLIEDTIKFDPEGILKEIDIRMVLYNFKDIASDSDGNNCALWYKNLKLPKDFTDVDSNCCFTFRTKSGFPIYFCSAQQFRCIGPIKRIIKKTKYGCLMFNKNRMPNPYENQNSAAALTPPDQYDQVLYDDSKNGIWKGLAFLHKIGDPKPIPDKAFFLQIENGYIAFYPDNKPNQQPIENAALIVRNLQFPCDDLPFTCDLTGYQEYYKKSISSDKVDGQILKREIEKIKAKLPKGLNYDHCCTVVSLSVEGDHEEYLICTRNADQGENIKRAISNSFDTIISTSNVNLQIPLAHTSEVYSIQIYDPKSDLVQYKHVRFGMKFMYDSTTHEKVLKYTDVQPDKYGKKCAMWFKQLRLPKQMTPSDVACCFMFFKNSKSIYLCSDLKFHCLKPSKVMMKTLRDGCLKGESGINLDSFIPIDTPEYNSPVTEILGEPPEDDAPQEKKEQYSFKHGIEDDLEVDEAKGTFKGWVMQSVLPNKDSELLDPREIYISISPNGWDNFLEKENRLIEHFVTSDMQLRCDKEFACKPKELLAFYEKIKDPRINLNLFSVGMKQTLKYVFEDFCVAVDFFVTEGDVSQKRLYCLISKHEKVYKSLLKVINVALQKSLSIVPYHEIKLPDITEDFHVEYIPAGKTERHNLLIKLGEIGLEYNNEPFLKYKDTKPCEFCYGVQTLPPGMHANHDCCIKFKKGEASGIICEQQQYRCEYKAKSLTKFLYERCINLNPDSVKNPPGFCLIEADVPFNPDDIKQGDQTTASSSMKDFSSGQKYEQYLEIVDEDYKLAIHVKELIGNKLLYINTKVNGLSKKVVSSQKFGNEIMSFNSDGSITIEKEDGSQTIKDSDNTVSILKSDETMEIKSPDGNDYFIDSKKDTVMKLSDGKIISSDNEGGFTFKDGEDQVNLKKSGIMEIVRKDGRKSEVENGKTLTTLPEGIKLTRFKNGDVEMKKGEEKLILSRERRRRRLFRFKEKSFSLLPIPAANHRHHNIKHRKDYNCTK